jgi:hypothetical protein
MEHKTLDEIRNVADVQPSWLGSRPLTKCERLERWAEVLERAGGRQLKTLFEIEYLSRAERAALRADDSPLSVAFADTRLRAAGLAGDTVGEAIAFFGVSEMEMHRILCFCHHGDTMCSARSCRCGACRVESPAVPVADVRRRHRRSDHDRRTGSLRISGARQRAVSSPYAAETADA